MLKNLILSVLEFPPPTLHPKFFYFFLWCFYANTLVLPWAYNTQQVLLMEKRVLHPAQKSWTLRCPKDNQENPSAWTTVPNTSVFLAIPLLRTFSLDLATLEAYQLTCGFQADYSKAEGMPQGETQPCIQRCYHKKSSTWVPVCSYINWTTHKYPKSHGVHQTAAMVQWVSSKHHAEQLEVVLNSVSKPDLRFHANPFSFF